MLFSRDPFDPIFGMSESIESQVGIRARWENCPIGFVDSCPISDVPDDPWVEAERDEEAT
jgi:hypothetical protein